MHSRRYVLHADGPLMRACFERDPLGYGTSTDRIGEMVQPFAYDGGADLTWGLNAFRSTNWLKTLGSGTYAVGANDTGNTGIYGVNVNGLLEATMTESGTNINQVQESYDGGTTAIARFLPQASANGATNYNAPDSKIFAEAQFRLSSINDGFVFGFCEVNNAILSSGAINAQSIIGFYMASATSGQMLTAEVGTGGTYTPVNLYTFTTTAGPTANIGATFTNNGVTFTLTQPLNASQTTLVATGAGLPAASGTLTMVSGGSGNVTFSAYTNALADHTTNVLNTNGSKQALSAATWIKLGILIDAPWYSASGPKGGGSITFFVNDSPFSMGGASGLLPNLPTAPLCMTIAHEAAATGSYVLTVANLWYGQSGLL